MVQSEDWKERKKAVKQLQRDFADLPDKEQAWNDLLELTKDDKRHVRSFATSALGSVFQHAMDKEQAWNELFALTKNGDGYVRSGAASSLGSAFQHVTNKEQATKELFALTKNGDSYVRSGVASSLGSAFQHVTDKEQATKELFALTKNDDEFVRMNAAFALGPAFQHVTDKEQATKELFELTKDWNSYVRSGAASSLSSAFPYVMDKEQATNELFELTKDADEFVRMGAVNTFGSVFPHVTDKEQATNDLMLFTKDEDKVMRVLANHSLGKACIFSATIAGSDTEFREEMEKALEFFEKASSEATSNFNPVKFCLPFYRSFQIIISGKDDVEEEIQKYLTEAKKAVEGSESKEKLLEAVKILSNALKEVQKIKGLSLEDKQCELDNYRKHCENIDALLDSTKDKAPVATELARRSASMVNENIKQTITEIEEKAEALCRQTQGTSYEEFGIKANQVGKTLLNTNDLEEINHNIVILGVILTGLCNKMPKKDKGEACELLKLFNQESNFKNKLSLANTILSKVSSQISKNDSIVNTPATVAAFVVIIISETIDIFPSDGFNKHIIILATALYFFSMGIIYNIVFKK